MCIKGGWSKLADLGIGMCLILALIELIKISLDEILTTKVVIFAKFGFEFGFVLIDFAWGNVQGNGWLDGCRQK